VDSFNLTIFFLFAFLAGHGVFLSLTLFKLERDSHSVSRLLGLLLFLTLIRVGKSVATLAFPDFSLILSLVGLISMAAIGPLLLAYIKRLFYSPEKIPFRMVHLIPALLSSLLWSWKFLNVGYYLITFQYLVYLLVIISILLKQKEVVKPDDVRWRWALTTTGGLAALWLTFALQLFIYDKLLYLGIITVSLAFYYVLAVWSVAKQKAFQFEGTRNYRENNLEEYSAICLQIEELMKQEIYTDSALNLTNLAKRINQPPYLVSRAINEKLNKTFPELLVSHRIRKAEELLLSPLLKTYTIEGIAYECGFSTLSAFYTAFKKETGKTPSQFKKAGEEKNGVA
jgi:AraC-like DNA-binding protein